MKIEARNIKPSGVLDYNTSLTEYKEEYAVFYQHKNTERWL